MIEFTPKQQMIFDAEIRDLRSRSAKRKALGALPTVKQRSDALSSLRAAIENVERAAKAEALQSAGLFSFQTEGWLTEAQQVAKELRALTTKWNKGPKGETAKQKATRQLLARGMTRPSDHRTWLIGHEIPRLFSQVFEGQRITITENATGKGRRGVDFVRRVLADLEDDDASDYTIKRLIGIARRADERGSPGRPVTTGKTRR